MTVPSVARKHLDWIPDDLLYYPHQVEGIRLVARGGSMILADEMGLGKSIQALTVFAIDVQAGWCETLLVVCPATLKTNWHDEIAEHTTFKNVVVLGAELKDDGDWREGLTPAKRAVQIDEFAADSGPRIMIANYEQIISHGAELNAKIGFDVVIYDEAHAMKNPRSKRTKACFAMTGKRHMPLTGSPMLNHVDELWALLHRVDPEGYPNYWAFRARYCVFGGFKDKQIVGVKNEPELNRLLHQKMVRRYKRDVLDLPEKQYIMVKVPLHPEQRRLIDSVDKEMRLPSYDDAEPEDIQNALTKFLRIKQICGTTATIEGYPDQSFKLDRLIEDALELIDNGHKVGIVTQFRGVLAAVMARCDALGLPRWEIHGDVPKAMRVPVVKQWAGFDGAGVLGFMHQVGGVGLNMTAGRHLLRVDKLFVPKLNEQSEDRFHRIGSDKTQPVQIRDYLCVGTAELRVEQILKRKTHINNAVVEDESFRKALYAALKEAGM
jgi:SNF2 family DNA or RNA helicase